MLEGIRLPIEGLRLLLRERSLWPFAAAPILLAIVGVSTAAGFIYAYAGPLHTAVTAWMPQLEAAAWYTWLWIGPAKAALGLLGIALFSLAAAMAVAAAFLLANVVAAPFLDALSRRVEMRLTGAAPQGEGQGVAAAWREGRSAVVAELQRVLFFGAIMLAITILGIVVPGGQVLAPPLLVGLTSLFLPLQYASYVLDRRKVPFRDRRRWIMANAPLMVAFGGTAFLTFLVPGLNFLMIPALVVAGTMLAVRHPPAVQRATEQFRRG